MHYTVHIKPSGYNLIVKAGETVLDAALRQGYRFPHECQSGVCGACRGLILEGHVHYDDLPPPALDDDEREAGYALFCSAIPSSDLIIQVEGVIGPEQLPIKKLTYKVQQCEQLNETLYRVLLQPPAENQIDYHAGQYIEVLHQDTSPKPFSIANAPDAAGTIELHIRHWPENTYTGELIQEIQTTGVLRLRGPYGNCILRQDPPYPIIFIAGGAGIAPLKALIEHALSEGLNRPIYLYWGVRTPADLYLQELATRWAKHVPHFYYIPVLSAAQDNWNGRIGFVHEAVIQDHSDLAQFHVYASGPTEMVYAALHSFSSHGLNRIFMYSDAFDYPYSS